MDVWIKYNGEKKGTLSSLSLPIYRLLFEQAGFRTRWDQEERELHLTSGLQGKKVYLIPTERDDTLTSILANTKTFLSRIGVDFIQLDPNSSPSKDGEIFLQITWNPNYSAHPPRFHILHSSGSRGKAWAQAFHWELKANGFNARIKAQPKQHPLPSLELRCQLPEGMANEKDFQESITLILASALLRGLTKGNLSALLPYLSPETLRLILPFTIDNTQKTEQHNSKIPSESPQKTIEPITVIEEKEEKTDQMEATVLRHASLTSGLQAEVYFDHQVLVPNSENDPILIFGNMYIKNTGTKDLANPLICLNVTPADGIQLKGQIVPPKMVDTLGVQSFNGDGAIGWRYLEDDWFQKAKERGEYWVCPIQPLRIPPGEIEAFSNLQFSIAKTENSGAITVQGVVFFKDENLQFPSNNRIALSF